jgi:hypothetical protein
MLRVRSFSSAKKISMISLPAHRKSLGARCLLIKRNWYVDDPNNLPFELLRNISRIGVVFNNDSQRNEALLIVQSMLPQAKRIAPSGRTWNEILVEQQQEILEQKQRSRGFSR